MLKLVNLTGEELRFSVYKPKFEAENATLEKHGPIGIVFIPAAGKAELIGHEKSQEEPSIYADAGMANWPSCAGASTRYGFKIYTAICRFDGFEGLYNCRNVRGVPEPQQDTIYVVPVEVAKALRGRRDVIGQYTGNNICNACWNRITGKPVYRHYFMYYHEDGDDYRFWFEY